MSALLINLLQTPNPTSSAKNIISSNMKYMTYQIITGETGFIIPVSVNLFPITLTLNSSDVSRKIEISTDGKQSWVQPTYTISVTNTISVSINYAITHVRITGIAGNTFTIAK